MCTTFVGYLRVSTDRQGKSGLGLEAQRAAVAQFVAGRGANAQSLKTFTEVESGKRNPDANDLTIGIMALVAQQEREAISRRTKEALQAAKARGTKLGNPNGATHLRGLAKGKGAAAQKATANAQSEALRSTIDGLRAEGITSAYATAKALDAAGITTAGGGKWDARKVINVLQRLTDDH